MTFLIDFVHRPYDSVVTIVPHCGKRELLKAIYVLYTGVEAVTFVGCRGRGDVTGQTLILNSCPTGKVINITTAHIGYDSRWNSAFNPPTCSKQSASTCWGSVITHGIITECNGLRKCRFSQNIFRLTVLCPDWQGVSNIIYIRYDCVTGTWEQIYLYTSSYRSSYPYTVSLSCQAQNPPPTPMRLNCRLELHRRCERSRRQSWPSLQFIVLLSYWAWWQVTSLLKKLSIRQYLYVYNNPGRTSKLSISIKIHVVKSLWSLFPNWRLNASAVVASRASCEFYLHRRCRRDSTRTDCRRVLGIRWFRAHNALALRSWGLTN